MNCSTCKVNKIGPKNSPFGGFLCSNEHLQCQECNSRRQCHCGICGDSTKFVQMNFNSSIFSMGGAAEQQSNTLPTAPPCSLQTSFVMRDPQICCAFSKNYFSKNEMPTLIKEEDLNEKNDNQNMETMEIFKKKLNAEGSSQFDAARSSQTNRCPTPPLICLSSNFSREPQLGCAFSKKLVDNMEGQSQQSEEPLSTKGSKETLHPWIESNTEGDVNNCMETLFIGTAPAENSISLMENTFKNCTNISDFSNSSARKSTGQSSKASRDKKENIFTFEDDPNDANIIKTFQIRFLNSTDSLQNFYSNSKPETFNTSVNTATMEAPQHSLQNGLSKKNLPESETDSRAKVENYLKSCDSIKTNISKVQSPNFNCQHNHCSFQITPKKSALSLNQKTVSVSTESEPSLKSASCEKSDKSMAGKFKPQEYLVMPAVAVAPAPSLTTDKVSLDKFGRPNIDVRMQKVLETLQEQSVASPTPEKTSYLIKKLQTPSAKQSQEPSRKDDPQMALISQLINVHRAFYNPPNPMIKPISNLHYLAVPIPVQQEPPSPQFQAISVPLALGLELIAKKSKFAPNKPVPACLLNIPRTPIQCPESTCQRMIFVSDFNKHFVVDHSHLPMERIVPFQCKNFFLDSRLAHCGISKCHLLYLMRNKITDLGSSEYKDFLPILVMSTRISLSQMCGVSEEASNLQYFLIWITGIAPEEFPISVSLTVWSRSGTVPIGHLVYSGQMYSIRNSQRAIDVWQSGRMLMLSAQEIEALTNCGKDMLNLQLIVH